MAAVRILAVLAAVVLAASAQYAVVEYYSPDQGGCSSDTFNVAFIPTFAECSDTACNDADASPFKITCNVSSISFPTSSSWLVSYFYTDTECTNLGSATGFQSGFCNLRPGSTSAKFVCDGEVASLVYYPSSTDCSGNSTTAEAPTTCQVDGPTSSNGRCIASAANAVVAPIAALILAVASVLVLVL